MKKDNLFFFLKICTIVLTYLTYRYVFVDYLKPAYEAYSNNLISRAIYNDYRHNALYAEIDIDKSVIKYDSIGSDLTYEYYFNDRIIKPGQIVKLQKSNTIEAVYTEQDGSTDDVGTATVSFNSAYYLQTKKTELTVVENGGRRYAGAAQTWEITYTITPVVDKEKIKTNLLDFANTVDSKYYFIVSGIFGWYAYLIHESKKRNKSDVVNNPIIKENEHNAKESNTNTSNNKDQTKPYTENTTKQPTTRTGHGTSSSNRILCPKCGSVMVKRHGKYGYFYGCSNYPYCKGTRSIKKS